MMIAVLLAQVDQGVVDGGREVATLRQWLFLSTYAVATCVCHVMWGEGSALFSFWLSSDGPLQSLYAHRRPYGRGGASGAAPVCPISPHLRAAALREVKARRALPDTVERVH